MSKGIYRTKGIKQVEAGQLFEELGERLYVGIDVAKKVQYARFARVDEPGMYRTIRWEHPKQTPELFALCEALQAKGAKLEAVMEPTGTYGDPIRVGLQARGIAVFRVNGKQVHDMAEVLDRVPSLHDAKSGALLVQLHAMGASQPWRDEDETQRGLAAKLRMVDTQETLYRQRLNQLEAVLARAWPEATLVLSLDRAALLALLAEYGSPARIAQHEARARALVRRVGGSFLEEAKIDALMEAARTTCGVAMVPEERQELCWLAQQALELRKARREAAAEMEAAAEGKVEPTAQAFAGRLTAAVFIAAGLDPRNFESPKALLKGFGLNLREHSSGTKNGARHISKRGSGTARRWLYWSALRLVGQDPVVAAWARQKAKRDGGVKMKAIVAVMRKLVLALWHVARGQAFDAKKLFDVRRLDLEEQTMTN